MSLEGTPANEKIVRSILKSSSAVASSAPCSAEKPQSSIGGDFTEMQSGHQSPAPKPSVVSDKLPLKKASNFIVKSKTPLGMSSKKHLVSPFMISASSPVQKNRRAHVPKPTRFDMPLVATQSVEVNENLATEPEKDEIESIAEAVKLDDISGKSSC